MSRRFCSVLMSTLILSFSLSYKAHATRQLTPLKAITLTCSLLLTGSVLSYYPNSDGGGFSTQLGAGNNRRNAIALFLGRISGVKDENVSHYVIYQETDEGLYTLSRRTGNVYFFSWEQVQIGIEQIAAESASEQ